MKIRNFKHACIKHFRRTPKETKEQMGENIEKSMICHKGSGFKFVLADTISSATGLGCFCFTLKTDCEYFGRKYEKEMSEYIVGLNLFL